MKIGICLVAATLLVGCGGGDTTVIEKSPGGGQQSGGGGGGGGASSGGGVPDVEGLSLPTAKQQLKAAGYQADIQTDAALGVIVPSNFTVCDQSDPAGNIVPIEVDNDNC